MRCDCCNVVLTPQESVRRFKSSGEFTNTCTACLSYINLPTVEGHAFDEDEGFEDDTDTIIYDVDESDDD